MFPVQKLNWPNNKFPWMEMGACDSLWRNFARKIEWKAFIVHATIEAES